VTVGSTQLPDLARQKGSTTGIHSGDNRLLNAVFSNNQFYTCHTVKSGSFPCAARFLGVNTSNIAAPTKVLDRVIGSTTTDYYYPAVATNPAGSASSRICTVFNFSSATRFAGIVYTQMKADGSIQPLGLLKEGQNTYVKTFGGTRNRWGDTVTRGGITGRRKHYRLSETGLRDSGIMLLGVRKVSGQKIFPPPGNMVIEGGDNLFAFGNSDGVAKLTAMLEAPAT